MQILKEVMSELLSMFIGDARLSVAILVFIGGLALLIHAGLVGNLVAGILLALGCVVVLSEAVVREARQRQIRR